MCGIPISSVRRRILSLRKFCFLMFPSNLFITNVNVSQIRPIYAPLRRLPATGLAAGLCAEFFLFHPAGPPLGPRGGRLHNLLRIARMNRGLAGRFSKLEY